MKYYGFIALAFSLCVTYFLKNKVNSNLLVIEAHYKEEIEASHGLANWFENLEKRRKQVQFEEGLKSNPYSTTYEEIKKWINYKYPYDSLVPEIEKPTWTIYTELIRETQDSITLQIFPWNIYIPPKKTSDRSGLEFFIRNKEIPFKEFKSYKGNLVDLSVLLKNPVTGESLTFKIEK